MTGSFNCIDAIRIEAGLLFYPFDMDESNSPWEVGLGFAVSRDKQADYRGKEACMNGIGKEKVKVCGIIADSDRVIDADAEVFKDGNKIGVVTGPNFSPALNKSLAIVKIDAEFSAIGTELEIKGSTNNCLATVHKLPIYNSDKTNRTT
jgi:aminomethyltransferase